MRSTSLTKRIAASGNEIASRAGTPAVAHALLRYTLFPRLSWLLVIVFRESALKPAAWFSCVVLNQITMFEVVACFSWALSLCPLCMRTSPHSTHTFNHGSLIFNFLLFPLISLNELKNGDTSRKFPCHCSNVWRSHKLSGVCVYKFNLTRALGRAWSVIPEVTKQTMYDVITRIIKTNQIQVDFKN